MRAKQYNQTDPGQRIAELIICQNCQEKSAGVKHLVTYRALGTSKQVILYSRNVDQVTTGPTVQ